MQIPAVIPHEKWILTGKRKFERFENVLPFPQGNEVQIKFHFCGVCGSDLSTFEGRRTTDYPKSLGHEFVAEVILVGAKVSDLSIGDIVVSDLNHRCGNCQFCLSGKSHLCENGQKGAFSNRAFAYTANIDANYLIKIDSSRADFKFTLVEPLSCVLHALSQGGAKPGEQILVVGCGGLGLCMGLAMKSFNISSDFTDLNTMRLSHIAQLDSNITATRNPADRNYDLVFDLSGSLDGLKSALNFVRRGGRVVSMSHLDGYGDSGFLLPMLTRQDIHFLVSYLNGEPRNMAVAVEIIKQTQLSFHSDVIEIYPVAQLGSAFENRRRSSYCKTIIDISAKKTG